MKSAESFSMLETLADKLGGAVGASRAGTEQYITTDHQRIYLDEANTVNYCPRS